MYIDESGNTAPLQQNGSKFLVLTGCIVHQNEKYDIEVEFRKIKEEFYQNPDIEIKSNFLRYANPDITEISSPIKLNSRERYDELERKIAEFMKKIPARLIAVAIDKVGYWSQYPAQNPYDAAYIFLLERFQEFLEAENELGLCIIDPREGTVQKKYIDKNLDQTHNLLRWDDHGFWKMCPRIIERVLFSSSDLTIGIQLTDLYCYPIFHIHEYGKKPSDYWRFKVVTEPKLVKPIKKFP
ncbi:MAG: DUF3800 domain-containing protein [Candidatus Jorgensenbacteria bacterium]|nr:DUF3800 domain-containing protein [Candidatus Jorgensenbacteria bacterium]